MNRCQRVAGGSPCRTRSARRTRRGLPASESAARPVAPAGHLLGRSPRVDPVAWQKVEEPTTSPRDPAPPPASARLHALGPQGWAEEAPGEYSSPSVLAAFEIVALATGRADAPVDNDRRRLLRWRDVDGVDLDPRRRVGHDRGLGRLSCDRVAADAVSGQRQPDHKYDHRGEACDE